MEKDGKRIASLVMGAVLVAFGALALAAQWLPGVNFFASVWPFFLIGFGAMFFAVMAYTGKSAAPLAIPGSLFIALGVILLAQSLTQHWASWSYAWTGIFIAVGLGLYLMGWWGEQEDQKASGLRVAKLGLVLLAVFGTFFEMVFNRSALAQLFFPTLLIALGAYLILVRGLFKPAAQPQAQPVLDALPEPSAQPRKKTTARKPKKASKQ